MASLTPFTINWVQSQYLNRRRTMKQVQNFQNYRILIK
ncbi:unnamed protein product [Paramecium primaurelia]|uniref:Uncharacterized protein n=1 Tax=Paramecium primaurelia TaxID=5886 RepID=A0A8S1QQ31_PARPR|nr:unnamed protein product [Paramecium primaurelia]